MIELPKPNLDLYELRSTIKFISDCKASDIDCHELEEYIAPLKNGRVNIGYDGEKYQSSRLKERKNGL